MNTTNNMEKEFCPSCGHKMLHKVGNFWVIVKYWFLSASYIPHPFCLLSRRKRVQTTEGCFYKKKNYSNHSKILYFQCAVTVEEDGTQTVHVNWQRLNCRRGLKYHIKPVKGGKHAVEIEYLENMKKKIYIYIYCFRWTKSSSKTKGCPRIVKRNFAQIQCATAPLKCTTLNRSEKLKNKNRPTVTFTVDFKKNNFHSFFYLAISEAKIKFSNETIFQNWIVET